MAARREDRKSVVLGKGGRGGRWREFQAEDGIRDHCVTGVQTCALPISSQLRSRPARNPDRLVEKVGAAGARPVVRTERGAAPAERATPAAPPAPAVS